MDIFKTIIILFVLLYFVSCQSVKPDGLVFEDCLKLSNSVFCIDSRLNSNRIDLIVQRIKANSGLSEQAKIELIDYFAKNKDIIIKKKEFEFSDKYLPYFRGYTLIHPLDRNEIFKKYLDLQKENERLRRECGIEE